MSTELSSPISQHLARVQELTKPVLEFLTQSVWARRKDEPGIADFVVGNPHDMPLPGFVVALRRQLEPRSPDWFAYKLSERAAQELVANNLSAGDAGDEFDPDDIFMTTGAFAGLAIVLKTILDPGDEVIYISPPWFFYGTLIASEGGVPVRVEADPADFDLDVSAIANAITPRTRAIIVNSPNNPTGRIYPPATLARLADELERASERNGRAIYLLSDEAYRRIVFDNATFHSPATFYPRSFVVYTYGKQLLTPGQRLGYVALPPSMPEAERERLRPAITLSQIMCGFAFPNALLQHALPELESMAIDTGQIQRKRDRLVEGLRSIGYQIHAPQGTFYLLPRAPIADDFAFFELLAQRDVFVLPGTAVELPGYFRISLTATEPMIDHALPVFAEAFAHFSRTNGTHTGRGAQVRG
jgi:aspartate aminotransferase